MQICSDAVAFDTKQGISSAFFGRRGGVSQGLYDSLNIGFNTNDDPLALRENRRRIAETVGTTLERLFVPNQIHGTGVITVDASGPTNDKEHADAIITRTPGIAIGVVTADCGPILLADPQARVIGAVHAGWRSALGGVLEAAITAMEKIGAERNRIEASIGPMISRTSYAVREDFRTSFLRADQNNDIFFTDSQEQIFFDLPGYIHNRLRHCGIASITAHDICTCANEAHFFSHRRSLQRREADCGRQMSVISLHD